MIGRIQYHYRDELTLAHADIEVEDLSRVLANVSESAHGPDSVKYSDLKSLNDQDLHSLTDQLNKILAEETSQKSG